MHRTISMLKAAGLFALSACADPALAEDWTYVASATDSRFFIKPQSVAISGQIVTVWQKSINDKADADGTLWEMQLHKYDCENRASMMISYISYGSDNALITSRVIPTYQRQWSPLGPDTIGEIIMTYVCKTR